MTPPVALTPTAALAAAGVVVVVAAVGVGARVVGPEERAHPTRAAPSVGPPVGVDGSGAGVGNSRVLTGVPMLGGSRGRPLTVAGPADRPAARWRWPLHARTPVLRRFVAPVSTWGAGHRGLDLATGAGASVLAVEGGRVSHAGVIAGRGTVSVEHRDGLVSTYEPVRATVRVGDVLTAGGVLGLVEPGTSASHCGARVCLHLGARRGDGYLDPWPLLVGGELALLPLR